MSCAEVSLRLSSDIALNSPDNEEKVKQIIVEQLGVDESQVDSPRVVRTIWARIRSTWSSS
jgi:hypothetical protein